MTTVEEVKCGWVQLNNTVVPYIKRHLANGMPTMLVPLPVIQYGAGLLEDEQVQCFSSMDEEFIALNNSCKAAGLDFSFDNSVDLISLHELVKKYRKITVNFLPQEDPFGNSHFKSEIVYDNRISTVGTTETEACVLDLSKSSMTEKHDDLKGHITESSSSNYSGQSHALEAPLDLSQTTSLEEETKADVEIISTYLPPQIASPMSESQSLLQTSPSNGVYVRPIKLQQRTIPCIIKAGIPYVLVETIRKAYFSYCSLRAFMFMVERCVSPFIYDLSANDVSTIMSFAKNPTSLMKCSRVISVRDADQMLPIIKNFLARVERHRNTRNPKTPQTAPQKSAGVKRSCDMANLDSLKAENVPRVRGTVLDHRDITSGMVNEMLPKGLSQTNTDQKLVAPSMMPINISKFKSSALGHSAIGLSNPIMQHSLSSKLVQPNTSTILPRVHTETRIDVQKQPRNMPSYKDVTRVAAHKNISAISSQFVPISENMSSGKDSRSAYTKSKKKYISSMISSLRSKQILHPRIEVEESLGELLSTCKDDKSDNSVEASTSLKSGQLIKETNLIVMKTTS